MNHILIGIAIMLALVILGVITPGPDAIVAFIAGVLVCAAMSFVIEGSK